MVKVCKGGSLVPEGATSWVIPYTLHGEGETQCVQSGGVVVEEGGGGGCTSAQAAQTRVGPGNLGLEGMVNGAFAPALRLRESVASSDMVRDLDLVNASPEVAAAIEQDSGISERLGQAVGMASGFALDLLLGATDRSSGVPYSAELHEWLTAVAYDIRDKVESTEVREALDRVVNRMSEHVGAPVGEVYRTLLEQSRSRSGEPTTSDG